MQSPCQSAGGTTAGNTSDVDTEALLVALCGCCQSVGKKLHLRGSRPFLWREYRGGIEKRGVDIAGNQKLHSLESCWCGDGTHCAEAAVGGGRSTQTDDDALGTEIECRIDELPGADGGCGDGIVPFRAANELQSGCECHFDDCRATMETPRRIHWCTQRPFDTEELIRTSKCLEGAFTPISQRNLRAVVAGGPTRIGNGFGYLMCRRSAAKLVDRRQDPHGF